MATGLVYYFYKELLVSPTTHDYFTRSAINVGVQVRQIAKSISFADSS